MSGLGISRSASGKMGSRMVEGGEVLQEYIRHEYMVKQGAVVKSWKRRYFSLNPSLMHIAYFKYYSPPLICFILLHCCLFYFYFKFIFLGKLFYYEKKPAFQHLILFFLLSFNF